MFFLVLIKPMHFYIQIPIWLGRQQYRLNEVVTSLYLIHWTCRCLSPELAAVVALPGLHVSQPCSFPELLETCVTCFPDPLTSPASSLFNDFGALSISQRRKVGENWNSSETKRNISGNKTFYSECFFFFCLYLSFSSSLFFLSLLLAFWAGILNNPGWPCIWDGSPASPVLAL